MNKPTKSPTSTNRGGARSGSGWKRPASKIRVGRNVIKAGDTVRACHVAYGGAMAWRSGTLVIDRNSIQVKFDDNSVFIIMA